jgi:hypothetical protein
MAIIIQNYDTLTLKLEDNLDQFDRYSENPKHFEFFSSLVCIIILFIKIIFMFIISSVF